MDIEFHYYITYILARKAGFSADDSGIIAYASQHTDDNTYNYCINFDEKQPYLGIVSQTMDITKPQKKRKLIYPIFHFFPGDPTAAVAQRKDGRTHSFNTTPGSKKAQDMFDDALGSKNRYRIGIAAHVFADTWAHQNFCGLLDHFNALSSVGGAFTPNIGHADAGHNPDLVCHQWIDGRLIDSNKSIDNNTRFIDAAEQIYAKFLRCINPQISGADIEARWVTLKGQLTTAMSARSFLGPLFNSSQKARIIAYKGICNDIPDYDKEQWRHTAVNKVAEELDIFDRYWGKENFWDSRWYKFQKAAQEHHNVSMNILADIYG